MVIKQQIASQELHIISVIDDNDTRQEQEEFYNQTKNFIESSPQYRPMEMQRYFNAQTMVAGLTVVKSLFNEHVI